MTDTLTHNVSLTDTAREKVKALIDAEGNDELRLRIDVKTGGCSGFIYQLYFDERTLDGDVFEHEVTGPSDRPLTHAYCLIRWKDGGALPIVMDRAEVEYIRDTYSEVDVIGLCIPADEAIGPGAHLLAVCQPCVQTLAAVAFLFLLPRGVPRIDLRVATPADLRRNRRRTQHGLRHALVHGPIPAARGEAGLQGIFAHRRSSR